MDTLFTTGIDDGAAQVIESESSKSFVSGGVMRTLVQRLIYRKWFYGFLMLALWIDSWTDITEFSERHSLRELVSLVLSVIGALLVTVIFVDLQWRWPPKMAQGIDGDHTRGG